MEQAVFIEHIIQLLEEMSIEKKEEWILAQAKLVSEFEQQDFIMSLTGEKKIMYMPTEAEIVEFCEQVNNGDICVEYETHYCEFNSEGRYVDDWEVYYNDPHNAFDFLHRVFGGCHELICLEEYELARNVLDRVCRLEFQVDEAKESEDCYAGSTFTVADAIKERLLPMEMRDIGYDWMVTTLLSEEDTNNMKFAEKLVEILHLELCKELQLSDFVALLPEMLLDSIEKILQKEVDEINVALEAVLGKTNCWREHYDLEMKKSRNRHLFLDLQKNCRKQQSFVIESQKESVLEASWQQIQELLQILSYQRYIDDQLEISQVWDICAALIKRDKFEEEDWKLRKSILADMINHEYYDCYGCYDPMKDLSKKLCVTENEILAFADMLNTYSYYAREAADLYREHGRMEQYVHYLETHLGKFSKEYLELIEYYCTVGDESKARHVAREGLKNCKDDLTELFIFLLQDAKKYGEDEEYKKLYASAKRRNKANIVRINKSLQ